MDIDWKSKVQMVLLLHGHVIDNLIVMCLNNYFYVTGRGTYVRLVAGVTAYNVVKCT